MANTRTLYVGKNVVFSLICQFINLALSFISRVFFIKTLGITYLGVNGLFTNVLMVLSFAELGIGNAIIYHLYKPIAEGDYEKIKSLLKLYKKAYQVIFAIVLVAGLLAIPFLQFIVDVNVNISVNIYLIYILFLTNTAFSYLFSFKKSLITANQKNYIVLVIEQIIHIIQVVAQIFVLIIFQNFVAFLMIQIIGTLTTNIICSLIANKLYPFIKQRATKLPVEERKAIFSNVKDLSFYKFGSVILNGTDNILISAMIDLDSVGLVSNYILLNNACSSFLGAIMNSFVASLGNFNVKSSNSQKYSVFKKMFYICFFVYGYASVGLLLLSNELIPLWLGDIYLIDQFTQVAIILGFLVSGVHFVLMTFRSTLGYFKQGRFSPLVSAIINIVLSILFCNLFGLAGIFLATPIARIMSIGIVDCHLIFKKEFNVKPYRYYFTALFYFAVVVVTYFMAFLSIKYIPLAAWAGFLLKTIIVSVVYCFVFMLFTFWKEEFKGLKAYVAFILDHFKKKH